MLHRYSLIVALLVLSGPSIAQDYPYDEALPETSATGPAPAPSGDGLPVESAAEGKAPPALKSDSSSSADSTTPTTPVATAPARKARGKRIAAISRMGFKLGGNFSLLKVDGSSIKGPGLSGAFALGWDLPYQPIFLEAEIGYRSFFINEETVHSIPLRLGLFYRSRIGKRSLWRPGIAVSLDTSFETTVDDAGESSRSTSISPSLQLVSTWELRGFLIEPALLFMRAGSASTFLGLDLRFGYRF